MASGAQSTGSTKVDAVVQNVKAADPNKLSGLALYSRFALAGAVCCSVTHGGLTPVDVYVVPIVLLQIFSVQGPSTGRVRDILRQSFPVYASLANSLP